MAIDLHSLKNKLNELTNKKKTSDALWKPKEGSNVVRIIPLKATPSMPFIEAYFHYLGGKTYLSPLTIGNPDPIAEFAEKLRGNGGLSKEEWAETKKFVPKPRTYAAVIVRGEESEGVRLWGFGKTTYAELLGVIADPEYGDITDIAAGRDIKVEFTPQDKSPTHFPQTNIRISPRQTPLTSDQALLKSWTSSQPELFDIYSVPSYDDLKGVLNAFLNPSSASVTEVSDINSKNLSGWDDAETPTAVDASKSVTAKVSKSSANTSKSIDAEFDEMFNG